LPAERGFWGNYFIVFQFSIGGSRRKGVGTHPTFLICQKMLPYRIKITYFESGFPFENQKIIVEPPPFENQT
jgi:hypothetical protein